MAHAATIRVPADQPTIQAGIDAASAKDTVLVAPGTFAGPGNTNLDFGGTDLVLRSEAGPAATTIDGGGVSRGFRFHGGETDAAVVDGFTLERCHADPPATGAGMLVEGASPTIARKPEYADLLAEIQAEVDRRWARLKAMAGSPVL